MAEAASIAGLNIASELRSHANRSIFVTERGLTVRFSLTIPSLPLLRRRVSLVATRAMHDLSYALYPFGFAPMFMGVLCVVFSPSEYWVRSGPLASYVWDLGARIPGVTALPTPVRVGLLAAMMGLFILLGLAFVQRYFLSFLLRYKGYMTTSRKGPSLFTKAWFSVVSCLTRGKPMTYTFQNALPRQPVPSLQSTVDKFLQSARCLQDDAEYARTKAEAEKFLSGSGPLLNRLLTLKSYVASHYTTDWWESYVYKKSRGSLMINSNYYVLDSGRWRPTKCQEARAAVLLYHFALFNDKLNNDAVAPLKLQNAIPLDMWQYERTFATSRIPGLEMDTIEHWDPTIIRHVAVLCKGSFYFLNVYTQEGLLREPSELEVALAAIKVDAMKRNPRPAEAALAALTSLPRTHWAEVRSTHFSDGQNRRSLEKVESALFFLHLDMDASPPDTWTGRGRRLIHGDPQRPGVWFDKSVSMTVFTDGKCGLNAEHAWADAPCVAHLLEEAMIGSERGTPGIMGLKGEGGAGEVPNKEALDFYTKEGHAAPLKTFKAPCATRVSQASSLSLSLSLSPGDPVWGLVPWQLSAACEEEVVAAQEYMRAASENFDLAVTSTLEEGGPGYGKDFIKKCSVSPDAYVQSALQLAYFRDTKATEGVGKFEATYESSMTRMFLHGRTETVRPVTGDMCAFVRAMEDEGCPPAEKLKALQKAAETHVTQFQNAMIGQGIDRHLFGLFCVSVAMGVDSPFLKSALSAPWKLSTSQQPQQQTELWDIKNKAWEDRISPGGGFGPVSPDGYGVSYMVSGEKEIFFHISALKSVEGKAARTDVQRFRANLFGALADMKKILSLATSAPGGAGGEKKKA